MVRTPEEALREIKSLLESAENLASKLQRIIPAEVGWLQWRLQQHQRSLDDLRRNFAILVNEAQESMLWSDSALWVWRGERLHYTNYNGLDPSLFPSHPHDFEGKTIFEVLSANNTRLHRWKELWRISELRGSARLSFEEINAAGIRMRYTVSVLMKSPDERHVHIRPTALPLRANLRRSDAPPATAERN